MKRYTERRESPFDHQREIRRVYQWKDFAEVDAEFRAWVAARSWTSGDGPKANFADGVEWLRERKAGRRMLILSAGMGAGYDGVPPIRPGGWSPMVPRPRSSMSSSC